MFLIEIVIFFVLLIVLSRQSARIGRLENRVYGKEKPFVSTEGAPVSASAPLPADMGQTRVPEKPRPVAMDAGSEASSGRVLAVLGIVAVFIGVAFFLKYAFDNNWIDPVGRVLIGLLAGAVLMGIGQMLRKKYLEYSDFLMGGGLALLYLSFFSCHFFYHLISPFTAWFFMSLVTALGFVLSIRNATKILAFISVVGGVVTPFLAYSGGNDMVALFGYLTVLNLGVLAISLFKKWPELVFAAFVGTVMNFGVWYSAHYASDLFGPALSFVFLSFLIFLASSIARSVYAREKANEADYFVLGGNAIYLALMGYILINPAHHNVLGAAAVFVGVIYGIVAFAVNERNRGDLALNIFLPGLAVTFLAIAVPLQFDGTWIAVGWLVESLALYAVSVFIGNRGFQVMGALAYVLGILGFVFSNPFHGGANFMPLFNNDFGVLALAVVVAYSIAYIYHKYGSVDLETQKRGVSYFVVVANVITIYAISSQIVFYFDMDGSTSAQNYSNTMVSLFWAFYAALLTAIGFTKRIAGIRRLGLILFIVTAIKVLIDVWSLGQIYRIVSLITFGVVALGASFAYAKYKDRLKDIV